MVALLCTASIIMICFAKCGAHITFEYSKTGLASAVYKIVIICSSKKVKKL